jgi:hypothetical protein
MFIKDLELHYDGERLSILHYAKNRAASIGRKMQIELWRWEGCWMMASKHLAEDLSPETSQLVSLQFCIYFWILTEGLPKRVTCVFRRLGLAWLGYLDMFKDLELHYGERVSIPKSKVGLGTGHHIHEWRHPRAGHVTTHLWVTPRSCGTCRPAVLFVRRCWTVIHALMTE